MMSGRGETAQAPVWLIVPMYNAAEYLLPCLESIASQSYGDFHALLIDDESTDTTLEMARGFARRDSRFEVVALTHRGVSAIRNYGIDHASGRYLSFVDADDCLHPEFLSRMLSVMQATGAQVAVSKFHNGREFRPATLPAHHHPVVYDYETAMREALYQRVILNSPWAMVIERQLLGEHLRYREEIRYEDLDSFYRFYEGANMIAYLPEPLYFYRQNASSFMNRWDSARLDALDVTDRIVDYMRVHHPNLTMAAEDRRFSAHYNMLLTMLAYRVDDQQAIARCWGVIRSGRRQALTDSSVRLKNKLGALLSYAGLSICKYILALNKR